MILWFIKYALVIEDPIKTAAFFNNNASDTIIMPVQNKTENEKGLINFLDQLSTGLKLIEATDNTFSNWKELKVNN